jgi:hypothetical protein
MFHAFLLETGYFLSPISISNLAAQQPSLTNFGMQEEVLAYRPSPRDSAERRFFEWSVGSCRKPAKLSKGVKRRLIKISAGAIIIFW